MRRGIIYKAGYRPLFSGHETFTLRYGWLKKSYDAVKSAKDAQDSRAIFFDDDAIAKLGVGKNMVRSMRHWCISCGVIAEDATIGMLMPTEIGDLLFAEDGLDPYLENPGSLWLLHWNLCSGDNLNGLKTTWYWAINYFSEPVFTRDRLVEKLARVAVERNWASGSQVTLKRDVECFVRCYEMRHVQDLSSIEDSLDSIFSELGLLTRSGHQAFSFVRGEKPSLPNSVFVYALNNFWKRHSETMSLSFDSIAYDIGSPGRVFMLDEAALAERLLMLEDFTKGVFRWSETAGLRQALRTRFLESTDLQTLIRHDYEALAAGGLR